MNCFAVGGWCVWNPSYTYRKAHHLGVSLSRKPWLSGTILFVWRIWAQESRRVSGSSRECIETKLCFGGSPPGSMHSFVRIILNTKRWVVNIDVLPHNNGDPTTLYYYYYQSLIIIFLQLILPAWPSSRRQQVKLTNSFQIACVCFLSEFLFLLFF